MRILIFGNLPIGFSARGNPYGGAGWISSMISALCVNAQHKLAYASLFPDLEAKEVYNGVTYYAVPKFIWSKISNIRQYIFRSHIAEEIKSWGKIIDNCNKVVIDFQPDIVFFFGTESEYVLLASKLSIPYVIHLQGIINPIKNAFFPPALSPRDIYKLSPVRKYQEVMTQLAWERLCYREKYVLSNAKNVIGRTEWDKRVSQMYNKDVVYHYCSEILREPFYIFEKRIIPQKIKIVSIISAPLYKGADMILKTAKILKEELIEDFEWIVYGNVKPQIIERIFNIKHDEVNVNFAGVASAELLKATLLHSTCYFHSSYIDNSPNSICEAQILGVPVIACNVGGISTLINDNITGFLVPANDPFMGACKIYDLAKSVELNLNIGKASKRLAENRHNRDVIMQKMMDIFNAISKNG